MSVSNFYVGTFRSMCAVPSRAHLSSSLILCFVGMLLRYFLNDFVMVPVAPITGTTCTFTFHMRSILFILCKFVIL